MLPETPRSVNWLRAVVAGMLLLVLVLTLTLACGGGEDTSAGDNSTPDVVVSFPTTSGQVTPRPRKTSIPTSVANSHAAQGVCSEP